jgi:hypothetical protein
MQDDTTQTQPTLTRKEKWRIYDREYKMRKYHTDPTFREKGIKRALLSYYSKRLEEGKLALGNE